MYVDFDLLVYLGTILYDCTKCSRIQEHQVDLLKDREPRQLLMTCGVCKRRQTQLLSDPVTVPEPNAPEPVLTD